MIEKRPFGLNDEDSAIIFKADGTIHFYAPLEPVPHFQAPFAAMLFLTGEGDRMERAAELVYEEMQVRYEAAKDMVGLMQKMTFGKGRPN